MISNARVFEKKRFLSTFRPERFSCCDYFYPFARQGLYFYLKDKKYKTVLLPSYVAEGVFDPFKRLGYTIEFYDTDDLTQIVTRSAMLLKAPIIEEGAREIAKRARGTPRIANRLLRRVRDYAEVRGTGEITREIADAALQILDVDPVGFDLMDRKLLEAVLFKFGGGPVGITNLAAAIGEEVDTIEDVLEPYLIQQGFLHRTPRGRIATTATYRHFGITPPSQNSSNNLNLWDNIND